MKKSKYISIIMILSIVIGLIIFNKIIFKTNINNHVLPDEINNEYITGEYGSFENAQKMVKEVMTAYYLRGPYYQYNYPKTNYYESTPENATSQDGSYSVCAAFISDVYAEAFGVLKSSESSDYGFPQIVSQHVNAARNYYNEYLNGTKENNGTYLLYYNQKEGNQNSGTISDDQEDATETEFDNSSITYTSLPFIYRDSRYDNLSDYNALINILQPGDIVGYSAHVLMVYDLVKDANGNVVDALLLNSTVKPFIRSRLDDTNKIGYIKNKSKYTNQILTNAGYQIAIDTVDVDKEGTFKRTLLSSNQYLVKKVNGENQLTCEGMNDCFIVRPFYNNNGKAIFNYAINKNAYDRSTLRTNYPGLFIEKTVNVGDSNSVYLDDEIEYKIAIKNNGYIDYNQGFTIEEEFSDYVQYINENDNDIVNGKIKKWVIGNMLKVGQSIEIRYKVKVLNNVDNLNKEIIENGKLYSNDSSVYIQTGTIKNKIIPKVSLPNMSYQSCYELLKDNYEGLSLIDEIYHCSRGENIFGNDFSFTDLKFDLDVEDEENADTLSKRLFVTDNAKIKKNGRAASNALVLNNNADSKHQKFINMILNNYWGGIRLYNIGANETYQYKIDYRGIDVGSKKVTIPSWSGSSSSLRAKNIYDIDFKEGDVLIYNFMPFNPTEAAMSLSNPVGRTNLTHEIGMYAFIYINGKFVGKNSSKLDANGDIVLGSERNEFTYHYYESLNKYYPKDKNGNEQDMKRLLIDPDVVPGGLNDLKNQLSNNEITEKEYDELLKYVNYQSLFTKDNYVIFRPELIIKEPYKIDIVQMPNKLTYYSNDTELILDGLKLNLIYNDGTHENLSVDKVNIAGFNNDSGGTKTITISYNGLETSFSITSEWNDTLKDILEDNGYNVGSSYVSKFTIGDSITSIKNKLGSDVTIETNQSIISTGAVIKRGTERYTVVIKGDLTGEGKVNSGDLLQMRKYLLEEVNLTGAYKEAGIIESVGNIKSLDLLRLRQYLLGEYVF